MQKKTTTTTTYIHKHGQELNIEYCSTIEAEKKKYSQMGEKCVFIASYLSFSLSLTRTRTHTIKIMFGFVFALSITKRLVLYDTEFVVVLGFHNFLHSLNRCCLFAIALFSSIFSFLVFYGFGSMFKSIYFVLSLCFAFNF